MRLDSARGQLTQTMKAALESAALRLNEARSRHKAQLPARVLERRLEYLTDMRRRIERVASDTLEKRAERLARLRGLLRTLGPESAFQRGFSITLGADGKIVRSVKALKKGDLLRTKLSDGEIVSEVME
ncbi:MAG: exodeoxyribonuclease VII large subunit [Luteolibacter sp.]